jgi:hypothetical protein
MAASSPSGNWFWNRSEVGQPGIGGGIAAMFKAEGSAPPPALKGLFPKYGQSSLRASMFAREAVANSWDAFWISEHSHQDFEISFRFREYSGAEALRFSQAFDTRSLSNRIGHTKADGLPRRTELGLGEKDCLGGNGNLRVLEVTERWGGGMGGCWKLGRSALERALIKVGWAQSEKGANGSFGYGKAAVAQGSRVNSLIAYTCFPEDPDEPGVSRRLLGATYWRPHSVGEANFNGFSVFGKKDGAWCCPFENEAADQIAESLGLAARDPEHDEDMGTSFVLLDPSFSADELRAALVCNWWPALQRTEEWRLHLFIADGDGPEEEVEVGVEHPLLGPFVRGYLAAASADAGESVNVAFSGQADEPVIVRLESDLDDFPVLGALGLVQVEADSVKGPKSLVALMRHHGMVISYRDTGSGEPLVRGVFNADFEINEPLRQTEPPEHDKWLLRQTGDHRGTPEDYAVAKEVTSKIDGEVAAFRRTRVGPVIVRRGFAPTFGAFFDQPGASTGKRVPVKGRIDQGRRSKRKVHVYLVHPSDHTEVERPTREPGDAAGSLRARASVKFDVMSWVATDSLDIEFQLGARFVEDGSGGDFLPVRVTAPVGLSMISDGRNGTAKYLGVLRKGHPLIFDLVTDDYSDEWSVDTFFDAISTTLIDPGVQVNGS